MTSPWSAGWVGWTEKRVEDVLAADALLAEDLPEVRWVLVGGPDSAYRGYEAELHRRAPGWSATRLCAPGSTSGCTPTWWLATASRRCCRSGGRCSTG